MKQPSEARTHQDAVVVAARRAVARRLPAGGAASDARQRLCGSARAVVSPGLRR